MRPIPITEELLAELNQRAEPGVEWRRITMQPPKGSHHVEPVEVAVETKPIALNPQQRIRLAELRRRKGPANVPDPREPLAYVARVAVTKRDLEAIEATGEIRLTLLGDHMQPWALWAPRPEDGSVADGRNLLEITQREAELRELVATVATLKDSTDVEMIEAIRFRALALIGVEPVETPPSGADV